VFKEIMRKDGYKSDSVSYKHKYLLFLPIVFGFTVAGVFFRYFGVFTFYSNLIGFGLVMLIIFIIRRDLIYEGIVGGFLLVLLSIPGYLLTFHFFPYWLPEYWRLNAISGVLFLGIPYEDLVWWFIVGANLSIVYDYYNGLRLRKLPEEND